MQRRAVAVYVVFFLLLGAGSYAMIAVAEHPPVELAGETYGQGDTFTVGDETYTVASLGTEGSGGGHGGGGGTTYTGELTYVNETADSEESITLSEGANVTLGGQPYVVHFRSSSAILVSPDRAGYQDQIRRQDRFAERVGGLWWVTMLSGSTAVVLIGLAFLPVRG